MADEELLRSIRIVEPDANKKIDSESTTSSTNYKTRIRNSDWTARLDVCQKGRRKYAVLRSPNTYFPDINDDYKFEKVDRSMSDDEIIKNALSLLKRQAADNGYRNFEIFSSGDDLSKNQMVLQDPWKDSAPTLRHYGFTYYYLNDGSQVHIEWINDVYSVGSKFDNADGLVKKRITYFPYSKDFGTDRLSPEFKDQSDVSTRNIVKYQKKDNTFDWADKVEYKDTKVYTGNQEDSSIIEYIISNIQSQISRFNGVDSKLALCNPDTESCKLIRHVDFNAVTPPTTTDDSATKDLAPGLSRSSDKTKLFLVGLPDDIQIKAGENLPDFSVYVNKIPDVVDTQLTNPQTDEFSDLEELDGEYVEASFNSEAESPIYLNEVAPNADFVADPSTTTSYTPTTTNSTPGVLVTLPRDYSHTSSQGYNILNSNWIGDLIVSAKSHIGHPTFDISGTEKGNLGCASAVSMIFYRAFGVHMKTGKAVSSKPSDIGSFGTKGTSEAAGWFKNTSLYQKINWKDAQPGDIMNTARNFSTNKAGHIGVVVDVKDKNGSWAIISNSSKGFAGGGGGAVKQNYSVKAWQSVTDRNPSETFAFRYIGPKLSPGQTA